MARLEAPAARAPRLRAVRAPPGLLVLADGAAPGARLPARGPGLPCPLLPGRFPAPLAAGGAGLARPPRAQCRRRPSPRSLLIPALFVFAYLAVVVYIGVFAFRKGAAREGTEDYFLAGRSLGQWVFLLSLFGTNMTA